MVAKLERLFVGGEIRKKEETGGINWRGVLGCGGEFDVLEMRLNAS